MDEKQNHEDTLRRRPFVETESSTPHRNAKSPSSPNKPTVEEALSSIPHQSPAVPHSPRISYLKNLRRSLTPAALMMGQASDVQENGVVIVVADNHLQFLHNPQIHLWMLSKISPYPDPLMRINQFVTNVRVRSTTHTYLVILTVKFATGVGKFYNYAMSTYWM